MKVSLHTAVPDDAPTISKILAESWKKAYIGIVPQEYLDALDENHSTERMRNDLSCGKLNAFLLLEDDVPVGVVGYFRSRDEKLSDWGEIQYIYVRPGYCHKGYGEKLLHAAVEALKELGFENCFLWVLKENKNARDFYAAMGFRSTDDVTHSEIMGKQLTEVRYSYSIK